MANPGGNVHWLWLTGCGFFGSDADKVAPPVASAAPVFDAAFDGPGLVVALSDAPLEPAASVVQGQRPLSGALPLDAAATEALLGRLPDPLEVDGDRTAFVLRKGSPPPPLPGSDTAMAFPPAPPALGGPPAVANEALTVFRTAPEGEVPMAPHVSLTFDQPMIAVSSHDEAQKSTPAVLTPAVDGHWRWLGTKTLVFDPVGGRLPMATSYTVEVPAGTRAAGGPALAKPVTFSFATPALRLQDRFPTGGPQGLRPVIIAGFDQRVDVNALFPHLTLTTKKGEHPLVLATQEDLANDKVAQSVVDGLEPGRFVALVPARPLERATTYRLRVAQGSPSAEGPRPAPADQWLEFATYAPLRIQDHRCGWSDAPCPPGSNLVVSLNNPIDPARFDTTTVTVAPEIPGMHVQANGQSLTVSGATSGRTLYTVTVPATLMDTFGQSLGKEETRVFRIGPAEKTLEASGDTMVVLDPSASGKFGVWSTNHDTLKIKVHRVSPGDYGAWLRWNARLWYDDDRPGVLPGTSLHQGTVHPDRSPDQQVETAVDLNPYLKEGYGQFIVMVEPTVQPKNRWERQLVARWVQVTRLGLVGMVDSDELVGFVTDLATGEPLTDVAMMLADHSPATVQTATDGLAVLSLPTQAEERPNVLLAQRGPDLAMLPESTSPWNHTGWLKHIEQDSLRWYVADDRGLYRPGETARVVGWLRRDRPGPTGGLTALPKNAGRVDWQLTGPRGNEVAKGTSALSPLGGFSAAIALPADMNLGHATLTLIAQDTDVPMGAVHNHALQIEEFRRPEFEVAAEIDHDSALLGETVHAVLTASYYAGGPLPNTAVQWSVQASPAAYRPPGQADYTFGSWTPWWQHGRGFGLDFTYPSNSVIAGTHLGTTDARGVHRMAVHFSALAPARAMSVRIEGVVTDVNRQAIAASSTLLLHPAATYVGLKAKKTFVDKGKPVEVNVVVVDVDGSPVKTNATLSFARLEWERNANGQYEQKPMDEVLCEAKPDAKGMSNCSFETVVGGNYRVLATVTDGDGRKNETEQMVWVSGGASKPARDVALEPVLLIPEAADVAPGQVARVLVQAPFFPAEGVYTLRRSGLLQTKRFTMDGPTMTLEVPLLEAYVPDVTVQVDLVGQSVRTDDDGKVREDLPKRLAHATGSLTLRVPPVARTLQVTAIPGGKEVAPGTRTGIALQVKRADGTPVANAELAVVVADEAVLAMTGYQLPDPIEVFYASRGPGVADYRIRSFVALGNPDEVVTAAALPVSTPVGGLGGQGFGYGGGGSVDLDRTVSLESGLLGANQTFNGRNPAQFMRPDGDSGARYRGAGTKSKGEGKRADPIAARSDMSALALFAPDVRTDADGKAVIPLQLPDSLTRYRIMVVAVDAGNAFGSADAAITARLPLMVRPSAPRFLNFGDQFELPIVVQNHSPAQVTVDVAVRGTNVRFIDAIGPTLPDLPDVAVSSMGKRIVVPANDRVEVRFPAATVMAGTARFQAVGVVAGVASDAQTFTVPVWTPATTEAFATYGSIEGKGMVQPVKAPANTWPQFGGLEVTTSSTQLQALTDAVVYLQTYPYECNEQLASRVLAIASLRDVLDAFDAEGLPPTADLEAQVAADLARLAARQHWNGGFAFWRRGDNPWPFLSIHVANAFARAKGKGFTVPDEAWQRSLSHLRDIERYIPDWYSIESKRFLRAYALDVRHRMGDTDVPSARALYREAGTKLGIDALGFLLPTLHAGKATTERDAILKHIGNNTTESAGTAHFVTNYSDGAQVLLHSDRRADGIVLEALIEIDNRDQELVQKVVRGLLGHKTKGRWGNTQENAFVLLALDRYFRVYEKETPDFVARVWLGEDYAGDHTFKGRTTERAHLDIPMALLTEHSDAVPLTLVRDGDAGRLYYRIGMRYAPRDLRLEPRDEGFAVSRRYEAVDDPSDVHQASDGSWEVKAGARVKVVLSMATPMRRNHVALVDPMPAGFEAENPALATTGALPPQPPSRQGYWWWTRTWWEHENLRDERVEAFASLLWDGVHNYEYIARATTPGRFVVPPTRAEEMYAPETMGRSSTDQVVIR